MATFTQALAAQVAQAQTTNNSLAIRGQASGSGAPSNRVLGSALRQAGVTREERMEVDRVRATRPVRSQARARGNPMDQTGRHRRNNTKHDNNTPAGPSRNAHPVPLSARIGTRPPKTNLNQPVPMTAKPLDPRRAPVGTRKLLKQDQKQRKRVHHVRVQRTHQERAELARKPLSFPVDVAGGFMPEELVANFVNSFCATYFNLFDTDRSRVLAAYAPTATISMSCNTIKSFSNLAKGVENDLTSRPKVVPARLWLDQSRNLQHHTSTERRLLKTAANPESVLDFWAKLPATKHPLHDATMFNVDAWALEADGSNTRLMAVIQGEFQEVPNGTFRSFSRTFVLADAPEGSPAQQAGFPATLLSDTLTVHVSYLSSGAFEAEKRSISHLGIPIDPSAPVNPQPIQSTTENMIREIMYRTGMNLAYADMCLTGNGGDFDKAMRNFEEIRATIPAEAYVR